MSEYWKSTPKYWCKHCSTYVRDTKLERTNHEATAKHQSALKRFLRDLHRNHENELRDKDRAKREVDRLNGVQHASSTAIPRATASSSSSSSRTGTTATAAQRQKQWEQLADMGIDVPTELRGDMAMAGEWTVTNTRVIHDAPNTGDDNVDSKTENVDSIATGVRKRPKPEGEDDHDEEEEKATLQGLFKKSKKWGRDARQAVEDDAELDALLSTTLVRPLKKEEEKEEKKEVPESALKGDSYSTIKKEEADTSMLLSSIAQPEPSERDAALVKQEQDIEPEAPAVVFKKRKPKNLRPK
ncbi:hypothetical protein F5Y19DRAFT_234570 [Xylariaceae sp. FL1651]|nr:hypothetical protein F5Y19DRAFT_234570 [Xylariaceae sp. FL1651]